jgi:hypothetical protein
VRVVLALGHGLHRGAAAARSLGRCAIYARVYAVRRDLPSTMRPLAPLSMRFPPFRAVRKGAYGIRTRATAVRGRRPRPLDECARRGQGSERERE